MLRNSLRNICNYENENKNNIAKCCVHFIDRNNFKIIIDKQTSFIPFAYNIGEKTQNVSQNVPQNVPQKSDLDIIIEMITNNPNVTRVEMSKAIGKTTKTVQRIIKESKCIVYVGSSKKGHWEIIK